MPIRIIDQRTGEPVDYPALQNEAIDRAADTGESLPTACREVAKAASPDQWDSVERQLRRLRNKQANRDQEHAGEAPRREPAAGFGVWARDLQAYVERLEDELGRIAERQEYSAHRMKQFKARAGEIYALAERRLEYLKAFGRERAVRSLKPYVGQLGTLDPEIDAAAFYDGEVRAMELTLIIASRVIEDAETALSFLDER